MKEIIREAVNNRMPDKESIRINAMQEKKKPMPKRAYAVLAVAVMLAVCTCITVPMMINEPQLPPVTIETTTKTDSTPRQDDTTLSNEVNLPVDTSCSDDTTLSVDPSDTDDHSAIGGGWPVCELHHTFFHYYSSELIDLVGEENFMVWAEKLAMEREYIPFTTTQCPFPGENICEFIEYFGITNEQLIEIYKSDFYNLQYDMKALMERDYEALEKHAIEIASNKSYKKLERERSVKFRIIEKIGEAEDERSKEYYNSITDNGKHYPVDKVTILELVENTSLTREDIQDCLNIVSDRYEYDISLLFENREEYKKMISELDIPYYESEVKLIDGLLHIE